MSRINVTVAAIIQRDDRFLIVEERDENQAPVFNQPAGHVEHEESIIQAIIREVDEETGLIFDPHYLVGNYFLSPADNGKHYLRFCFFGSVDDSAKAVPKDSDITAAHWLTLEQILDLKTQLRSALVLQCIEDYLSGQSYPMSQFQLSSNESALADACYNRLVQNKLKR